MMATTNFFNDPIDSDDSDSIVSDNENILNSKEHHSLKINKKTFVKNLKKQAHRLNL